VVSTLVKLSWTLNTIARLMIKLGAAIIKVLQMSQNEGAIFLPCQPLPSVFVYLIHSHAILTEDKQYTYYQGLCPIVEVANARYVYMDFANEALLRWPNRNGGLVQFTRPNQMDCHVDPIENPFLRKSRLILTGRCDSNAWHLEPTLFQLRRFFP